MGNLFDLPHFIAVEGPLRVGKSTLAQLLSETLHARLLTDPDDNPFLDRFYQAQSGMAFATQMWFLMERSAQMSLVGDSETPVVSDYLFEKDRLFAYVNLNDAELALYNRYYQMFSKTSPAPDLVIYLQATPDVLRQRMKRKGVPGERAVSEKYIEQIIHAYEHFFFHYTASDLLVVNTSDIDFVNNNRDLQLLLRRLSEPVKGTQYFLPLSNGAA
ncbi:deoxynucleoside kinase [Paracidobacterium acidisoli]|uniref:Deoxynucleoside kinase n=1 Tax=Paracidobacterium acidisoli TaxID=2303751 RepID=A0A372IME3_9BACT|nr:deoxynucleoside kinase [Paracidobacterium acidisoli]MBT9331715.1 deoxynucleoside kinase [Paracidobacterium acidisoli]